MADEVPITLHEFNDETLSVVVTPCTPGADLSAVSSLEFYLKTGACNADGDASTLRLTSTDPTQIQITAHSPDEIDALVFVPPQTGGYERFYRIDGISNVGKRRTAAFGPVTMVDL